MLKKIQNALISIFDKSDLEKILRYLEKYKINLISSGGTYRKIKKLGYNCIEIEKYTKFKEMLDGRVKTLHPKIHAGILSIRSNRKHQNQMKKNKFKNIDLIIVNFYPFQEAVLNKKNSNSIVENIDVGGPAMVRAAAKNFKDISIITDKKDYGSLINQLRQYKGCTDLKFRKYMASKAFNLTAYYDSMISNWFNKELNITFPDKKTIPGRKLTQLRYGENPHQKSSIYINDFDDKETGLKKISGKNLSYNNYNDIFTGLEILSSFKKTGTVIVKHGNPSGASINKSPLKSFQESLLCDPMSAFGGIVACNFKINKKIANEIKNNFFEVIICNGIEKNALKILSKKKNLRIIDAIAYKLENLENIVSNFNSILVQSIDNKTFSKKDFRIVSKEKPDSKTLNNLIFAFNVCRFVKSNAIVIAKDDSTIGIGSGQPSRLDSCKIAINKMNKFHSIKNNDKIVAASDAFFPFVDGIETLVQAGVSAIIQPSGSLRDKEVIKYANKTGTVLVFSNTRHFRH